MSFAQDSNEAGAWAACSLALLEAVEMLRASSSDADSTIDQRTDAVEVVREVAVATPPGVTELLRLWCTGVLTADDREADAAYAEWLEQCVHWIIDPDRVGMLLESLLVLPRMPIPPARLQSVVMQRLAEFAAEAGAADQSAIVDAVDFIAPDTHADAADGSVVDPAVGAADGARVWLSRDEQGLLIDALENQLAQKLASIASTPSVEALDAYCEQLSLVLDAFGLLGLGDWSAVDLTVRAELAGAAHGEREWTATIAEVEHWHAALKQALLEPQGSAWPQLRDRLTSTERAVPVTALAIEALDRMFSLVNIGDDPAQWNLPVAIATDDDIDLSIAADASAAVIDGVMHDAPRNMNALSAAVDRFLGHADASALMNAQRIAHTMKGDANTVGVRGIGNISHTLEDVLVAFAKYPALRASDDLRDLLRGATDVLGAMVDAVTGRGETPAPSTARAMLQRLLDARPRLREPPAAAPAPIAHEQSERATLPSPASSSASRPPAHRAQTAAPLAAIEAHTLDDLVVSAPALDRALHLVDAAFADLRQIQRQVDDLRLAFLEQRRIEQERQGLVAQLDDLATLRGAALASARTRETTLDPLELDHFHELHQITQRFLESHSDRATAIDASDEAVSLAAERCQDQERVQESLRRELLAFRTVPIADHVFRWQRVVRQTARNVGKSIELTVTGQETLIDRDVLEGISDAITHVLRNAVDHGIETESERRAAGKSPTGHIDIAIVPNGLSVMLRIGDDGRGLDEPELRERAAALGITAADIDLWSLLSLPGFTTRDNASAVSGRGMGLDIVAQALRRWRASAHMNSSMGKGLTLELQVPVTHVTVPVLVTSIDDGLVAISAPSLRALRQLLAEEISRDEEGTWCQVDGSRIPVLTLGDIYGSPSRRRLDRGMLLPLETRWAGSALLALENVVAIREVVVRPLPAYFGPLQGVRGVATFEDGRAMPVLDLEDLPLDEAIALRPKGELDESATDADVLIVDDSLSVRRAVAEVLGEAGLRTTLARDGLEAMALLQKQRPRVVVADLEMPRINGLELTAHIRRTPELARLPVLLLTSRMGRRHRAMAHTVGVNRIMFKPYDPTELVDTVTDLAGMSDGPRIAQDEDPPFDS